VLVKIEFAAPYLSRVVPNVLHSNVIAHVHSRLHHGTVGVHGTLLLLLLLLLHNGLHDGPHHVLMLLEMLRLHMLLHRRLLKASCLPAAVILPLPVSWPVQ
jgi:hypothetical protein